MKTHPSSKSGPLFREQGEQSIRLIKAAQASKLFGNLGGNAHVHGADVPHKKPEIRMIHSGADYCDLEVVCGCGESTQVRCWNNPAAEQQAAA
jgi:hypothetical protein